MSFPQFAFNNVKRNARAYFAYFLSSSFMVMVFFTYALFIFHPDINQTELGHTTTLVMQIMECIIYVFSFLFVLFSIGSFLKARNKEFGILTILGAEQGQISRLVFVENLIIGAASIITGIASGLILSKLFLLLSARVVGIEKLNLYLPGKAILLTVGAFALLFVIISAFTLFFIRRNHVLNLLQGTSRPKKDPKASILISVFGIILLAMGYYTLNKSLVIAAVTGIAGTYFFFTQITVLLMRLLKFSRRLVWSGTNLIWISEMAYKIKDNARVLFMVTVVTSISCMSVAFVMSMDQTNKDNYKVNPYAIQYSIYNDKNTDNDLALVGNMLKDNKVAYQEIRTEYYETGIAGDERSYVTVMSASMYNLLAKSVGIQAIDKVHENETMHVISPGSKARIPAWYNKAAVSLQQSNAQMEIIKVIRPEVKVSPTGADILVVSDSDYEKQSKSAQADDRHLNRGGVVYIIPQWTSGKIPSAKDPEIVLGSKLKEWGMDRMLNGETKNMLTTRGGDYYALKQSASMMSFVGIFITAVLSISSASFLYFKLHTELTQDQQMYRAMSKIGLKTGEMSRAATIQIAALFFVPIVVSTIQTLVVLNAVREDFGIGEVNTSVLTASLAFVIVQMIYFLIVRSRYIHRLRRVMV